ncbi:hypothetical protein HU675_0045070 [Bradyrhizobium septentrionale]|uniref:hypothetical protein n=1 Tax=Bradyrhizobium septentrionale TaxID=1404411 RepID=UPI0015969588|nr:hypothetical protein [Bradyrhizobium septentrionale]UGY24967.1 hypothetical protein HU675_0045070 [Bradyrhizobium septentrionale]
MPSAMLIAYAAARAATISASGGVIPALPQRGIITRGHNLPPILLLRKTAGERFTARCAINNFLTTFERSEKLTERGRAKAIAEAGKKIPRLERAVPVRFRPAAPIFVIEIHFYSRH